MTLPDEAVEAAARALFDASPFRENTGALEEQSDQYQQLTHTYATAALNAARPIIRAQVLEEAAKALEDDAKLCDCHARSEGECACGAWSDYKIVPMERAVDLVRALKENHP